MCEKSTCSGIPAGYYQHGSVDKFNMSPYAKNLPVVLSKYLTLGLDFMTILEKVTVNPAKIMNMEGKIGTLRSGAYADIAILK